MNEALLHTRWKTTGMNDPLAASPTSGEVQGARRGDVDVTLDVVVCQRMSIDLA